MKKICFISGVISRSGGTERVGSIIANSLSDLGYDVTILSFWNSGEPYFGLDKTIKVDYMLNPKTEGKLYRTYLDPVWKLHKYICKNEFDIVIDIDTLLSLYTTRAIKGTKCKLISWEHFNYWTMEMLKEKKRFKAKKLIKKYAKRLVVLTEEDRQKHIDEYSLSEDFVITMPNPCISNIEYEYHYDKKRFLAVGRLVEEKNFADMISAWKIVEKKVDDWDLIIVGKGELEKDLRQQIKDLNLQRVTIAGHSDHVEEYYKSASCYVLSSVYEGFPMVILEAQSYGLPVISYDCKTGPRDLVHHNFNGMLVEDKNIDQLAKSMIMFTKNTDLAMRMSLNAYNNVQKFNLKEITKQWVALIENV
ncbi:TPA: glycosyltransferase family 4 protein [Enterococcus faecium]|nr:glycosyltransferase family 4 protein [Enterococcus faecium]